MRDFIDMEKFIDHEYARKTDHRFHALGCCMSPNMFGPMQEAAKMHERVHGRQPWASQADLAWVICLHHSEVIDRDRAGKLVQAIRGTWDSTHGGSGEERILEACAGDMDLASTVNYGRTLQEPMFRLKLRDTMLEIFDDILELLQTVHRLAMENLDTIMVGHTHMNHGQPITYAHFMISAFDGIMRGLKQFEQAYEFTNVNSGGCGSCSGTTWPVDRELMADLLGMDGVMEPTYDCEASQDHSLAILFALSNLAVHLSRYAMNHYIWAFDEIDMIRTHPSMCGVSSFMPQKCDSGSNYERVRIFASNVMAEANRCMTLLKGEPHADVLMALHLPDYAADGMVESHKCIRLFNNMLEATILQKERMLRIVKAGYSCATELASYLIREKGYGGRVAHSITATMVRMAREKGWKSHECTGELLDQAAEYLNVKRPGLDTDTVRACFDPEAFIKSHNMLGGTAPEENERLLEKRKNAMLDALKRHGERKARVKAGLARMDREADKLL